MYVFGNDQKSRGCFSVQNIHEGISQGATLYLPEAPKPMYPKAPEATEDSTETAVVEPYLITAIEFAQKEKYHLVECFDDTVHTYAFGFDPKASLITVHFTAFIMAQDGSGVSAAFGDLLGAYNVSRLSQSQQLATVAFGSAGVIQGFVVALSSSTADAQHNLQNFSITLLAVEAQSGSIAL